MIIYCIQNNLSFNLCKNVRLIYYFCPLFFNLLYKFILNYTSIASLSKLIIKKLYLQEQKNTIMNPTTILLLIAAYFGVLILISFLTGKNDSNTTFFTANKQSPWYLVAFGMIGATLSGVTFISVPGWVEKSSFSYVQMMMGFVVGYLVIAKVLLPLYYNLNLTSIYTYLEERFGKLSYKTGATYFLISRTIGASFRLFLVANVLQFIVFDKLSFFGEQGVPYWITVTITILLIWLYTFRSGIKTIIWTDTLQTAFMLISVGLTIYLIASKLQLSFGGLIDTITDSPQSKVFFFEDIKNGKYFWKQFLSGAFMAIVMTGLDQDMMQKNLTCKNLKDAQKNMYWFTLVIFIVNIFFLSLGILLNKYAALKGIEVSGDKLFTSIATTSDLGVWVAGFFILGLIAAAYSSADSALTALTTSFSIDILDIEKKYDIVKQKKIRQIVHVAYSVMLILVVVSFKYLISDPSVISSLFKIAGFTYGPLLGLYAFGLFTKHKVKDKLVPFVAVLSVVLSILLDKYSADLFHFKFGFFILIVNGLFTFIGLYIIKKNK